MVCGSTKCAVIKTVAAVISGDSAAATNAVTVNDNVVCGWLSAMSMRASPSTIVTDKYAGALCKPKVRAPKPPAARSATSGKRLATPAAADTGLCARNCKVAATIAVIVCSIVGVCVCSSSANIVIVKVPGGDATNKPLSPGLTMVLVKESLITVTYCVPLMLANAPLTPAALALK